MSGFGVSCGASHLHTQHAEQKQVVTQEQVAMHIATLRLELAQVLRDEMYTPDAVCPECRYTLDLKDILRGFNDDPLDVTTMCPACGHRFDPKLRCVSPGGEITIRFFCPTQVLYQLGLLPVPDSLLMTPDALRQKHPAVIRSAVIHFGTIKTAFARINLEYHQPEFPNWKDKVFPFLGRLPDTVIGECVGVHCDVIRRMRKKHGVRAFSRTSL